MSPPYETATTHMLKQLLLSSETNADIPLAKLPALSHPHELLSILNGGQFDVRLT